jgi:EmrB/QacA subfamily drug resistance transporter
MSTETKSGKGAILPLACAAQFMVVLDVAIVNVALPSIQKDIGVEQSTLQWIVIAYGLMLGGFLLLGGRLGDHLGRRRVLMTGLVIFTTASLGAGLTDSVNLLIAARAVQGFGAALIPPTALAIIAVTFTDDADRNRALGIFGAITGVSATVGVIASGLLTDGPGWRWIFLINVPIGLLLTAVAAKSLPADQRRLDSDRFDVPGAVTLTSGLLLLVYGLNRGADEGWISPLTLGLFGASALLLVALVVIESRSPAPLIPGTALRNRTLLGANLAAFFTFGAFFSFIFLGSLTMQQVLGYSATRTGLAWLATTAISFVAAAITGGKLVAVVGVKRLLIVGQTLLAVSLLLLTQVSADERYVTNLLPAFLLAGFAGGIAAPAAQIGALSGVAESETGLASGLVETTREIGGALGVAIVSTVLVSQSGLDAYHSAFLGIAVVAAVGAVVAAASFPKAGNPGITSPEEGTGSPNLAAPAMEFE